MKLNRLEPNKTEHDKTDKSKKIKTTTTTSTMRVAIRIYVKREQHVKK